MDKVHRKPFGNFLIKRSIQARIILKILVVVITTGVLTTVLLSLFYAQKSQSGSFYYMSNDIKQDLELTNFLGLILPALLIAQAASFIITVGIGLFSSRKVAVPIYKIERWADQVGRGNLNTALVFREKREMKDITLACNRVSDFYNEIFTGIHASVKEIDKDILDSPRVREQLESIKKNLSRVTLKTE